MLCKDPSKRLTAFQVLNHTWIKEDGEAPDVPLDNVVFNKLKQFRAMNKFKKAALRVVSADELSNDEEYEEILEDMREEGRKFGPLLNVVIPRPSLSGESIAGVGKKSDTFVFFDSN